MKLRPYHITWSLCAVTAALLVAFALPRHAPVSSTSPIAGADALGGAFTLTDQDGKRVTEKSWPGKYLVLYFGFTHCPDVCPLGLNKLADALNTLPKETAAKIQPVFITVDPARDTAKDLKQYVGLFHPALIGLTGTQDEIDHVKKLFRVFAEKSGDGPDYMVNHSAFTYLVSPDGKLAGIYSHESTSKEMAAEMQKSLSE